MEKKTALYERHVQCGGKMVPFAGYLLPVQYEKGVIAEHMAVRTACGIFDVSHMGELLCQGKDACESLNRLMTNDFRGMYDGQARYSPMCNEEGGVVDDLIVYRIREGCYLIVVNAANKDKDFQWITSHAEGDAVYTDISETVGQIALQGPGAQAILTKLVKEEELPQKYYSCVPEGSVAGVRCLISKTGYTGEDGYELYMEAEDAPAVWDALLTAGSADGLIPCGLGARDTLRLEAAMPLYGHEMDDTITPLEAGLDFAVKLAKESFIGKEALLAGGEPKRKRIGLRVTGRGIIREHAAVYGGDGFAELVGQTTSGTHCPYLGVPVAMALVQADMAEVGSRVEVDVRGRRVAAEVVALPFYRKQKK